MATFKQGLFNKKALTVGFLSAMIMACSSTDEEVDLSLPAELVEINQQFTPEILWQTSAGDGVDDYYSRLKPVIAYGKLFTANRAGFAYAFDGETGQEVWQADLREKDKEAGFFTQTTDALIAGGVTVGINKVFLGSENGQVYALDAENGQLAWQASLKGEVIAAPAIDEGTLVVNSASGILKAFNGNTGEELWKVEQEVPPLTLRGISSPALAAGGALVGLANGALTVYILDNGQRGWTVEVGEATGSTELDRVIDVDAKPLVYGDKVYTVSARGNLAAIDLRSGRIVWKRQYSSHRQLSVNGNTLYLTDVKGHVYAIDRLTGSERWSQLALTNRSVTGAAVFNDHIVVGDFEGYLHWLDIETGDIVARHQVDSSGVYTAPLVANNILYTQSRDGDLQAIKAP